MTVRRYACAAAVAAIACGGFSSGTAQAAQPPEIHVKLIGSDQVSTSWTTHGITDCTMDHEYGGQHYVHSTGTLTSDVDLPIIVTGIHSLQLTCPGGVKSNKAVVYGPRSPINDLRTQFNESSRGVFGS